MAWVSASRPKSGPRYSMQPTRGLTVITTMATNPANEIVSADSATLAAVKGYLNGGGRKNYRNLLTCLRRTVDGKRLDTDEPELPWCAT